MKKIIIAIVVGLIYFVGVFGEFVQDDLKVIVSDPDMGKVSALAAAFVRPYYYMDVENAGIYRPLTSFSFYLNSLITGRSAWGFRLTNILFYVGVCILVFETLKRLTNEKMAFWVTLVFAMLPVHTEAVNNIVGRAELLSLGFVLLAVLMQEKKKWEMSAVMFFLGLLSKETAIVGLPILTYLMLLKKENKETRAGVIFFYVLVVICYLFLRTIVLEAGLMENMATVVENPLKYVPTNQRVLTAFSLVPLGVGKILWPVNLSYDYSFSQIKIATNWFDWRVMLGVAMMLGSIGSLFTRLRKYKLWILGQAFFWGPLAVTGNFLFPVGTIFGERLWFWPSFGVIILLSSCRIRNFRNKRVGYVTLAMILVLLALRTGVRNVDWLSQERLFVHDASYAIDSVMVQSNAAAMYLMKGDLNMGKKYMEKADAIYPMYPELLNNWGMYYLWTEDKQKAKEKFNQCLTERPEYYLCKRNLELLK